VRKVFSEHGPLARANAFFQPRQGQIDMAQAVAHNLTHGGTLVVEAGTGVGKTFAYLVPALLSGERVLLSTATKALQDQLFARDIPDLVKALGLPIQLAMLKGRGSYLCQQRLALTSQASSTLPDRGAVAALAKVQRWAPLTATGDLAEVPGLDEQASILPLITSTRENCLGSTCPHWRPCHVNQARREAMAADVVVINHHLFFADMAVRESGMAELLPTVRVVIFDEAHQLNETGVQFLGKQLSGAQLLDLGRDLLTVGLQWAKGLVDWQTLVSRHEKAVRDWRLVVAHIAQGAKARWTQAQPEGVSPDAWAQALEDLTLSLDALSVAVSQVEDLAPDFQRLQERVALAMALIDDFQSPCALGSVRWLEVGSHLRCMESPLDIADVVKDKLLHAQVQAVPNEETQAQGLRRSWVFTSATLGSDPQLRWFTEPCGLQDADILQVQSPFDYANQAYLYVPRQMVSPKEAGHSEAVAELAQRVILALGGRTLVLTTTQRALRTIADALARQLPPEASLSLLVQGQRTKRELMERFRRAIEPGEKGAVLVATASFWEGFDVPGDALQAVIIDKLPFPPPNDPLVEARSQRLTAQGKSPFVSYFLPEAGVSLKQGAGRLIRRESDRGLLVVADHRLVSTDYGRRLLRTLPPMKRLDQWPQVQVALEELTKK
jgi:ATP-dependent DNA helicase DinG